MAGKGAATCGHCGGDLSFLTEGEMTVIYDGICAFSMFLPEGAIDSGTVSGHKRMAHRSEPRFGPADDGPCAVIQLASPGEQCPACPCTAYQAKESN